MIWYSSVQGFLLLYLFVMAIASHFKHITYPKAQKEYGCAILVPEGSILPDVYKEEAYEFITYSDLYQAINSLDQERYDLVLFPVQYSMRFISAIPE